MSRMWVYKRGEWLGRWPSLGADEHGRRTLVLPIPFGPAVVLVLYRCGCIDCDEMRAQTARWEAEADR